MFLHVDRNKKANYYAYTADKTMKKKKKEQKINHMFFSFFFVLNKLTVFVQHSTVCVCVTYLCIVLTSDR